MALSMFEAWVPEEAKVSPNDYAYLDLPNLSDAESDLAMKVADEKGRFEWACSMNADGFSIDPWLPDEHFTAEQGKHLEECVCDWTPEIDPWLQTVVDWPSMCHFYWHFLKADVPGTPDHLYPWFKGDGAHHGAAC